MKQNKAIGYKYIGDSEITCNECNGKVFEPIKPGDVSKFDGEQVNILDVMEPFYIFPNGYSFPESEIMNDTRFLKVEID